MCVYVKCGDCKEGCQRLLSVYGCVCGRPIYIQYSLNAAFVLYTLISSFLSLQGSLQPQRHPSKNAYITHMFLLNATCKGRGVEGVGFMC